MAIGRASIPDLLRPGLLRPPWSDTVKKPHAPDIEDEAEGYSRGGRKRRRKGGTASGMMAQPRLDRKSRKMPGGGGMGGPLGAPAAAAPGLDAPMSKPAVPRGIDAGPPAGSPDDDAMMKAGGRLTAADRHALPSKDFALKGERYPIEDKNHARNALARVSQHGSSEEKAKVRNAVHRKFPDIGED